jgi:hypothetical protein
MMRAPEARLHINPAAAGRAPNEARKSLIALQARFILISAVRIPPLQQSFANLGARKFSLECPQLLDDGGELLADGSQVIFDAKGNFRVLGARISP